MLRVLKIACGLMGVLLLVIVGVIVVTRTTHPDIRTAIVEADANVYGGIFWTVPGFADYHRALIPEISGTTYGWSSDGSYLLVAGSVPIVKKPYPREQGRIYRIWTDNWQVDLLAKSVNVSSVGFSSDGTWMIYQTQSASGKVILADANGHIITNLTDRFGIAMFPDPVFFSDDNEWVYFSGYVLKDGSVRGFMASRDGREMREISYDDRWPTHVLNWLSGRNLLLFSYSSSHQSIMNMDNGETVDLPDYLYGPTAWLPTRDVLIMESGYHENFGIDAQSGSVLWRLPDTEYLGATPDGQWIYLTRPIEGNLYYRQLIRIRADGSEISEINQIPIVFETWGWTPDGKWLLFPAPEFKEQTRDPSISVYRMSYDGMKIEPIWNGRPYPTLLAWTPDNHWLHIYGRDSHYRISADGTVEFGLPGWGVYQVFHGWGPTINRHWQPPILAAIALTLITTPILLSRCRFRLHPR